VEVSAVRARFMGLVWSTIATNRMIGIGDEAKERVSSSLIDGKATDRNSVHDGAVRIWSLLNHSSQPSSHPEFTFQSEVMGGGSPRTRSPSLYPQEADTRIGSSSTEGGLVRGARESLDELGAWLSLAASRQ